MNDKVAKSLKRVWCLDCVNSKPPDIRRADYLIFERTGYYCLSSDGVSINNNLVGVCKEHLESKNDFQKSNTYPVDPDNPNIVKRGYQ